MKLKFVLGTPKGTGSDCGAFVERRGKDWVAEAKAEKSKKSSREERQLS